MCRIVIYNSAEMQQNPTIELDTFVFAAQLLIFQTLENQRLIISTSIKDARNFILLNKK